MDELKVAVCPYRQTNDYLVPYPQRMRIGDTHKLRSGCTVLFHKQLLLYIERGICCSDPVHLFVILPVESPPCRSTAFLRDSHPPHLRQDLTTAPALFEIACTLFPVVGLHLHAAERDRRLPLSCEPVAAAAQQCMDGIRRGMCRLPQLCLLLLQQPALHIVCLRRTGTTCPECLHDECMHRHSRLRHEHMRPVVGPVHTHFVGESSMFTE